MIFLYHLTIALISLVSIVLSCILFTNAIEFLGNKLKLGNNATGSILAVIGTGLPEVVVPIVAIIGINFSDTKIEVAQNIALGAILGSPFMLLTLALFLLGLILITKKRKTLNVDYSVVLRDLKYILLAYAIAVLFFIEIFAKFKIYAIVCLLFLYILFVYRTIMKSRCCCVECECEELYFGKIKINSNLSLFFQLILSLVILIFSSHFFVGEIKYFSILFNVSPLILSLFITPFATELPEIINSIIWLKQDKDDLALANILGAVVFQTTLLFSLGLILTPWECSQIVIYNIILIILNCIVFYLMTLKNKIVNIFSLLFSGLIYLFYIFLIIK